MRASTAPLSTRASGLGRTLRITATAVSILLTVAACDSSLQTQPDDPVDIASGPASVELGFTGTTTSGNIAANNLDASIAGLRQQMKQAAGKQAARPRLVSALLSRATFRGATADFDEALAVADGDQALKARVLTALHRFDDALMVVPSDAERSIIETVDLARETDLAGLYRDRLLTAETLDTFSAWAKLAAVAAARGLFVEADAAYLQALSVYRDVSPFAIAQIQFQRGVMWSERAGRPDLGLPLYREAVARLPDYVVAGVHLAELEPTDAAIARLSVLVDSDVGDPEPYGKLAELLVDTDPDRARGLLDRAAELYDTLLSEHPLAYADHGAEFFMGPGSNPERALALAELNLSNRPSERAHDLAIRAALASGESERACSLGQTLGAADPVTTGLRETLEVLSSLGCELVSAP